MTKERGLKKGVYNSTERGGKDFRRRVHSGLPVEKALSNGRDCDKRNPSTSRKVGETVYVKYT